MSNELEETKRVVKRALDISLMLENGGYGGMYYEDIELGKTIVKLAADTSFFGVFWKDSEKDFDGAILIYSDWMKFYGNVASDSIEGIADYMLYMMKEKGFNPFDGEEEEVVKAVAATEEMPF